MPLLLSIPIHFHLSLFVALLCFGPTVFAAEFFASVSESTDYDSNVYQDDTREQDFVFRPGLMLGADFADFWTAGYDGDAAVYLDHSDLFFHRHELYGSVNPAWGDAGEHEFLAELSVMTQRNAEAFSAVNLVQPSLLLMLAMEPRHWIRWSIEEQAAYRLFYDDTEMDSIDSFTRASVLFTAKTRTTLAPRIAFGYRGYPRLTEQQGQDTADLQLEAGVHLSQNVKAGIGLQADWAYRHAFEDSVLITRSMGLPSFSYIGDDFLFTGHMASVGMKSIFENGISFGFDLNFAYKMYLGWFVLDADGVPVGLDRTDQQLEPAAWFQYTLIPPKDASLAAPEFSVTLSYAYLRQWSNDAWYDSFRHVVRLGFEAAW